LVGKTLIATKQPLLEVDPFPRGRPASLYSGSGMPSAIGTA
jgi:hypothetical protein